MSDSFKTVPTPLGGKIMVGKPDYIYSDGVVILMGMVGPSTKDNAEIHLDQKSLRQLVNALNGYLED